MITLSANLHDIDHDLTTANGLIEFGGSSVEPFRSQQLTVSSSSSASCQEIWVGEDSDPYSGLKKPEDRALSTVRFVEFEGLRIQLRGKDKPSIVVARTAAGTTPLYVAAKGSHIVASWKFELAVEALGSATPNIDACRIFLEHGKSQTREQVITGVYMLWPGESATFDSEGLRFVPMDDPEIVLSSALADGARATDEFLRLIGCAMERQIAKATSPLIEISGGLDSSCVAIAASQLRPSMNSYGVIQPGAIGKQQRRRRAELVDLLGLVDHDGISWDPLPTRSLSVPECQITPYDDLYRMACVKTMDRHQLTGSDIVITGIGGDELTKQYTFYRDEWEVAGFASSSALVAATSRADMFMRRNIWPVNPLVDISVINFCRALPQKMRDGRLLNILALARAGLSDGFLLPRYVENFGNVLTLEAVEMDYDELFESSLIGDYGIMDVYAALAEVRDATLDGVTKRMVGKMYNTLKLEMTLRTYVK